MAPGFEYNFVEAEGVADDFKCSICHGVIQQATNGCDAHVFCRTCIQEYVDSRNETRFVCPGGCANEINPSQLFANKYIDRLILKLEVKCEHCDWTGTLLNLEQHHKSRCSMTPVKCEYEGCDVVYKRKDTEKHDAECLFKPIKCQDCCELYPRNTLEMHIDNCPMKIIACSFQDVGCKDERTRESMNSHMDSSIQYHLMLSNEHNLKQIMLLENANKVLKEENLSLREEFNGQIAILRNEVHNLKLSQEKLLLEKNKKEDYDNLDNAVENEQHIETNEFKSMKAIRGAAVDLLNSYTISSDEYKSKNGYPIGMIDFRCLGCKTIDSIEKYLKEKDFSDCIQVLIQQQQFIKQRKMGLPQRGYSRLGDSDAERRRFVRGRGRRGRRYHRCRRYRRSDEENEPVYRSDEENETVNSNVTSDAELKLDLTFSEISDLEDLLKIPTSYVFKHEFHGDIFCFHLSSIVRYKCNRGDFYENYLCFYRTFGGSFMFKGVGKYFMMTNGHISQFGNFESDETTSKSFSCLIDVKKFSEKKNPEWRIPPQYCLIWKEKEFRDLSLENFSS